MQFSGLHHLTAISADIKANRAFYTGVLGLRLVKKSINQDDVKAYVKRILAKSASVSAAARTTSWSSCRSSVGRCR